MKVKIELEKNEHPEDADEFLEKALKAKHECSNNEQYSDHWLNEIHDQLVKAHYELLNDLEKQISIEVANGD
jgi:hypothetical protein